MQVAEERLVGFRYRTYNFLRVLGKGSFATVYEAFDESTCNNVAIKAISMQHFKNPKIKELTEG
jgi:serine/threonine protein kinase